MAGGWLVWLAFQPWAGSLAAIKDIERNGSRFYPVGGQSTALYDRVDQAVTGIKNDHSHRAMTAINAGARIDPANPLFDYLRATALWRLGQKKRAVDAAVAGQPKNALWVYASSRVEPITWQWPEIELISRTAREMGEASSDDLRQLSAALSMADKVVWSKPAHPVRILLGISARQSAVQRLRSLALRTGNTELRLLCDQLLDEGRAFRKAWGKVLDSELTASPNAWVLQRALRDRDRHHSAATILDLDDQAERAEKCRDNNMTKGLAERTIAQAKKGNREHAGS